MPYWKSKMFYFTAKEMKAVQVKTSTTKCSPPQKKSNLKILLKLLLITQQYWRENMSQKIIYWAEIGAV